mgnify:CR=1 FL=1
MYAQVTKIINKKFMSEKLTIISHFYNEEYLLPWWIKRIIMG